MGRELGRESVQVGHVAAWRLEDLERVSETLLELAPEPAGRAGALAQRDEVTQNVSKAQLALGSVDVQVHGVAVRHDHPVRIIAQQGASSVTITTNGDLKQRGVNRRSDRQPPRIARLSPRRLIAHRTAASSR